MKKLCYFIVVVIILITGSAWGATLYCGPSSTGNGSGSNFSNLMALPNTTGFTRGNTYVIIEGSYGSKNLQTATSGSSTITIKKASADDSGVTGYSTSLYDAQAIFSSIDISTQYWIINGMTRTETTRMEAPAGYGIRVTGTLYSNTISGQNASNSQFSYLDIGGPWSSAGYSSTVCTYDNAGLYFVYSQSNITFTRCVIHNSGHGGALAMMHGSSGVTFDHCDFYHGWGKATIAAPNVGITNLTVKYSRFWNSSQRDECPGEVGAGISCEVGAYGYDLNPSGNIFYGNIFYGTASGGRNASLMFGGSGFTGSQAYNSLAYNNTFAGFPEDSVLGEIYFYQGSGNVARNNLFYSIPGTPTISANTQSNNVEVESNPFVDYANLDFRLSAPTTGGYALSSPYNQDPSGITRGSDGTWDLGAYEYTGGGGGDVTAPAVTITSPTSSSTYLTTTTPVTLSGSASDAVGVTSVTYSNSRGGSGSCTGTTSWTCSNIVLYSGSNVLTITATDAASNAGTDTLTVSLDNTAPSISNPQPAGSINCPSAPVDVTLQISTDENATCKFDSEDTTYALMVGVFYTTGGTTHTQATSLSCGATYYYYYRCQDGQGNTNTSSTTGSFTILAYEEPGPGNDFTSDPTVQAVYNFESGALATDSKSTNTLSLAGGTPAADTTNYKEGAASVLLELANGEYYGRLDANLHANFPLKSETQNTAMSVCTWARLENLPTESNDYGIVGKWDSANNQRSFLLAAWDSTGDLNLGTMFTVSFGAGSGTNISGWAANFSGASVSADVWYHLCVTLDGTGNYTFRVRDASCNTFGADASGTLTSAISLTGEALCVGAYGDSCAAHRFDGQLDETVFFNRAISGTEVSQICSGTFSSAGVDLEVPTLTIEAYPENGVSYLGGASIGGTSTDNTAVTSVTWSNNRGGGGVCSGTTGWTCSTTLYSGNNTITISALDAAANSNTDAVVIWYRDVSPIMGWGVLSSGGGLSK